MPRKFDLDDDSVVLIVGSGAGGGTLGNELAQKGIRTVILEAGPRIEREQKVTGVVYADKQGGHHMQRARIVCVAGNSIETPRILLNSASSQCPEGLANSSGQVGRNYMRHMSGTVWAVFEKPVHMYRGNTMAGCIKDERHHRPDREFAGGYYMQTLHVGLSFFATRLANSLDLPGWGCEFTRIMDAYEYMAGMWLVGEDMPQTANCVTLHPTERDQFGMPIPNVHFDDHENDTTMRNHAYKRGAMVYDAVGATRIIRCPPGPSAHNLGTCRQSVRPEAGVCNKWGQTHDIKNLVISDGSQFTTSTAENPTLTIVALAIRQADYIADQMAKHFE